MLYMNVNFSLFCDQFHRMNRESRFSYDAKRMLYDYLNTDGLHIELDIIDICCTYEEYTVEDCKQNLSIDFEGLSDDQCIIAIEDYLNNSTILLGRTKANTFVFITF